jgi:hypothetical protein
MPRLTTIIGSFGRLAVRMVTESYPRMFGAVAIDVRENDYKSSVCAPLPFLQPDSRDAK